MITKHKGYFGAMLLGILLIYLGVILLVKDDAIDKNDMLTSRQMSQSNEWRIMDEPIPGAKASKNQANQQRDCTIGIGISCIGGTIILVNIGKYQKNKHDL